MRRWSVALPASVLSGLLLFAAGEPVGAAPLAWVSLVPLFLAARAARRARRAALLGLVAGVSYFGPHLAWIYHFGWMAWTALVAVMAAWFALAGFAVAFFARFPFAPVFAAGAWVGAEIGRDRWPFGGFGWGAVGATQGGVPGVRSLAASIGMFGLSFLCAFAAAWIAEAAASRHPAWGSLVLVAAGLGAFVWVDAVRFGGAPAGRTVRIAVVQADVPRPERLDQDELVLTSQIAQTRTISRADVIVWPESSVGFDAPPDAAARVSAAARQAGVPILTGWTDVDLDARAFLNLVRHVDADGRVVDAYQKRHPVPFGEYVPLPLLRRFVSTLGQVPFDMVPGRRTTVFDVNGLRIGTPICFESAFPRDVRSFARAGAELIVVSTNDSSFERSFESRQHLANTRMRALELRQWVVQAALSGISAVIAPDGTVSRRTDLFRPAVVAADVRARPARSLYARAGDLFSYAWAAGTAAAALLYAFVRVWAIASKR
jgi:apolipoprotein N-acyltransferase